MGEELKAIAKLSPNAAIFVIGAFCIVTLGGMALGYDVEVNILDGTLTVTKSRIAEVS